MVVSALKAARKRTGKIRSNLHTGQYAGSISPGHSQGQTLVEPLALPGCRQTHQQVSSKDNSKKEKWTCHTHQWSQLPLVVSGNWFAQRLPPRSRSLILLQCSDACYVTSLDGAIQMCGSLNPRWVFVLVVCHTHLNRKARFFNKQVWPFSSYEKINASLSHS